MAVNITQEVENIRNATYARDVRNAMADSLAKMAGVAGDDETFERYVTEAANQYLQEHPESTTTVDYTITTKVFENVDQMKADASLTVGNKCKTLGYYTVNDGGGAYYYIRQKTDTDVDNAGTIQALENDNIAELIVDDNKVLIEQFGGKGDGEFLNDDAFERVIRSGLDIVFRRNCTYLFSGEYIELGDVGLRRTFEGNHCKLDSLSFKYNITSENDRSTSSMVEGFPIDFKDIIFQNNTNPIIITAGNITVDGCGFVKNRHCFAFPEYYVDYFHMRDCVFYQTENVISAFNYHGEELSDNGMYGDWIVFDRCSFGNSYGTNVYTSCTAHNSVVTVRNCIGGCFSRRCSDAYHSKFFFDACHFENTSENRCFANAASDVPILNDDVLFRGCYFYSTAMPEILDGIKFENCEINYGNQSNYAIVPLESGNFTKINIYTVLYYDEFEFKYGEKPTAPIQDKSYHKCENGSGGANIQKYDEDGSAKYLFLTSLEKDRLFFNGESANFVWTDDFTFDAGKARVITFYPGIDNLKNIYLHIYKVEGSDAYKCVIPVTNIYSSNKVTVSRENSASIRVCDEPLGILGYPWQSFSGIDELSYDTN